MEDYSKAKHYGILNQSYCLLRLLGEGSTSRVYLSDRIKDQSRVAIKIFKPDFLNSGAEARQIFVDELTALATLDHPNIVKMYEYGIDGVVESELTTLNGIWFIVLEYISERTLVDLVKQNSYLSEEAAKYFFRQMIDTLIYINSKGIAHRDIKLENMLVNESYQLKFADFGFASFSKEKQTQQKGTPIYIAPEIIRNEPYDGEQVDVFSCGVVLFAMLSGKYPFQWASSQDKKYALLIQHKYADFWKQFDKYAFFSDSCKDLLQSMFEYDPSQRINLQDISQHEWYIDYDSQFMPTAPAPAKKKPKTRGGINVGEVGGTTPNQEDDGFYIDLLEQKTYQHDGREIEISDIIPLSDVVAKIKAYFEINKKGKRFEIKEMKQEGDQKIKGLKFTDEEKDFEFVINFIRYLDSESQYQPLNLRFERKRGTILKMYNYIEKISHELVEAGLAEQQ